MSWVSRRLIKKSELCIVGGTNLLSSRMGFLALWKLMPWDIASLGHVLLLGVGWRDYMGQPDWYTRWMLQRVLSDKYTHSARDSHTLEKLGVAKKRVSNTACPTMWGLTESHCARIPRQKASSAVLTLTFYNQDPENDRAVLDLLQQHYKQVFFWPQQSEDDRYFRSLGVSEIKSIAPNLRAYDRVLESEDCDFVGTRLHGGIRALQKFRRSLILGIDNRATEIAKNFNLPVLGRKNLREIADWIEGDRPTAVSLPVAEIAQWKGQFGSLQAEPSHAHEVSPLATGVLQGEFSKG
jgi:polysaccharide pyruvyl transferase WcaK-like protein